MSNYTNTLSVSTENLTISHEATTIHDSPSHFLTQSGLDTTLKEMLASFNDKIYKEQEIFDKKIE